MIFITFKINPEDRKERKVFHTKKSFIEWANWFLPEFSWYAIYER